MCYICPANISCFSRMKSNWSHIHAVCCAKKDGQCVPKMADQLLFESTTSLSLWDIFNMWSGLRDPDYPTALSSPSLSSHWLLLGCPAKTSFLAQTYSSWCPAATETELQPQQGLANSITLWSWDAPQPLKDPYLQTAQNWSLLW